jgi:hypothetical protein
MDLLTRVLETMAWCSIRANINDPEKSLRSRELQPSHEMGFWYSNPPHTEGKDHYWNPWRETQDEHERYFEQSHGGDRETLRFKNIFNAETGGEGDLELWHKTSEWIHLTKAFDTLINTATVLNRRRIVEGVGLRRGQLLRESGWSRDITQYNLPKGRFVLCDDASASLSEGACFASSKGFFDDFSDIPAWDTWVAYAPQLEVFADMNGLLDSTKIVLGGNHQLLIWIPECLLDIVDNGMYVSSTEMFVWASEVDIPITRQLKDLGLLT